jgi:signal transduction histidine kinase
MTNAPEFVFGKTQGYKGVAVTWIRGAEVPRMAFYDHSRSSSLDDERPGSIQISLGTESQMWIVSVQDNGKGIPPEDYDRIFVPNFTTKSKGMGLGLAMVKNIIDSTDGTIHFKSELGIGTTFTVKLPLIKA